MYFRDRFSSKFNRTRFLCTVLPDKYIYYPFPTPIPHSNEILHNKFLSYLLPVTFSPKNNIVPVYEDKDSQKGRRKESGSSEERKSLVVQEDRYLSRKIRRGGFEYIR